VNPALVPIVLVVRFV